MATELVVIQRVTSCLADLDNEQRGSRKAAQEDGMRKGERDERHAGPTQISARCPLPSSPTAISLICTIQIYEQGDSLAFVCSGLGGGSLINAGVMAPTTIRARKDPRWPKEWERSWSSCQARASNMLQPESIHHPFATAKVMRGIAGEIEESTLDPIQLTVKFKKGTNSAGLLQNGCTACGNCLASCSYNAKGSTDKNYLALAIQAGCKVKTECQV